MATLTPLLGLHKPAMGDTVGMTIPNLAENMQIIDELLGGSRIVEMDRNESGHYAKCENGLGVAWGLKDLEGIETGAQGEFTVSLALALPSQPPTNTAISGQYGSVAWGRLKDLPKVNNLQRTTAGTYFNVFTDVNSFTFPSNVYFAFIAIGGWK